LARQPGLRLKPPSLIQIVLLQLIRFVKGIKSLADNYVAGCTGTGHFTGVFDFNVIPQQGITNTFTRVGLNSCALGTYILVG